MKRVRYDILRTPLGMELSESDLADEDAQFHIAMMDNTDIVGTIVMNPIDSDVIRLRQMAVLSAYQGRGIGKNLITFAEKIAKDKGFKRVILKGRETVASFYEAMGYIQEGEPFVSGEVTVPTVMMNKDLR